MRSWGKLGAKFWEPIAPCCRTNVTVCQVCLTDISVCDDDRFHKQSYCRKGSQPLGNYMEWEFQSFMGNWEHSTQPSLANEDCWNVGILTDLSELIPIII